MKGKCAKQDVVAVIRWNGRLFVGTNGCLTPQGTCPRYGMATGEGYDLCHEVCHQTSHAEVDACNKAPSCMTNATMYIFGHTYCCESCIEAMRKAGITSVVFMPENRRETI